MDEAPDNVVFFNDYTADNYAASARLAEEEQTKPKGACLPTESALLASAYIINPANIKLDGPDQYIQEHDFYENDEVLEGLERQKELMLQEMYNEPAKILFLVRQIAMLFKSYPDWPANMKEKEQGPEGAKKELSKLLAQLKDIFVDIEFTTKYKREDNLQPHGPLSRTPAKAFLEKSYSVVLTNEMNGLVRQLVASTKIGGLSAGNDGIKSSSNNTPNNGLVASTLLMKIPQPLVHELRVLLSTLKSDLSPLIPAMLSNQDELGFILHIVRDREEELAREIHERMQGERNRKKKEKRDKYLRSAQAYKSLTQGNTDTKTYENEWNSHWSKQKTETQSKMDSRSSPIGENEERNDWGKSPLGKRTPEWNAASSSTGWEISDINQGNITPILGSNSNDQFGIPPTQHSLPDHESAQEKNPLEFQKSIFDLCQKAANFEQPIGFPQCDIPQVTGIGDGWEVPDPYTGLAKPFESQVIEQSPKPVAEEKKEASNSDDINPRFDGAFQTARPPVQSSLLDVSEQYPRLDSPAKASNSALQAESGPSQALAENQEAAQTEASREPKHDQMVGKSLVSMKQDAWTSIPIQAGGEQPSDPQSN